MVVSLVVARVALLVMARAVFYHRAQTLTLWHHVGATAPPLNAIM
jgi:uncharacterized protein (DUF983 family)